MKHHFIFLLLAAGIISACTGSNKSGKEELSAYATGKTVLKAFSDTVKLDTFKVVLNGDEPKNMVMTFTITAHDGSQIYMRAFKATDLIDNYQSTLELKKESKQKKFITEEYNLFFEDENFLEPAVTENENPDENTPDKDFFNELKQSGLNGFQYRLSNENKVYIAWSSKERKVLPYYSCCKQK
ncbi:hypothetical protein PBAL39_18364 [Pedobacter sp. BAL39]|uniref:hypothetical protein n=1 Tax=Pedobacter sp. BAL39 TaxID=391596 RepID=UPI00015592EF|nr:hypothetical protein [Pedobacter sp. BAL39]EDM36865.1 hypothetical protein PBAL39_18364 [Pedobacter sp. BAL39]